MSLNGLEEGLLYALNFEAFEDAHYDAHAIIADIFESADEAFAATHRLT